jgi:serine protease inhibitor ecotin
MSECEFQQYIENKYINLIKLYIDKNDHIIILSARIENKVIDFLNENGYSFSFTEKHFNGREKNAIVDLLVAKCCNNIFIGAFNMNTLTGSSFSYYVSNSISTDVRQIMIDLDRITDDVMIKIKTRL